MAYQDDFILPTELLEQIASEGFDFQLGLIRILVNAAIQIQRQKYLEAGPYERSEKRQSYAHGYKPRTVQTSLGEISFDNIPQVREGGFYPGALK
jgi:putative transposase